MIHSYYIRMHQLIQFFPLAMYGWELEIVIAPVAG